MAISAVVARRASVRLSLGAVLIGAALAFSPAAAADNILINGGFENGDFTGWIDLNNLDNSQVVCPDPTDTGFLTPFEGQCYGEFGPEGHMGTLAQGFNSQPGQTYLVSFALASDGGVENGFAANFGGIPLFSGINLPDSGGFVQHTFFAAATDAQTTLSFDFRDDPGHLLLDAVVVSAAPEPATLALLGIGFAGLAWRRRH